MPVAVLLGLVGVALIIMSGKAKASEQAEIKVSPLPTDSAKPAPGPSGGYIAPLVLPLRRVTPLGYYRAPRYLTPGGGTTGDPKKAKQPPVIDHYHEAVDLACNAGEMVYAPSDCTVVATYAPGSPEGRFCENGCKLDFGDGRGVVFCDMQRVTVSKGMHVAKGTAVGIAGTFLHVKLYDTRTGKDLNPSGVIPYLG